MASNQQIGLIFMEASFLYHKKILLKLSPSKRFQQASTLSNALFQPHSKQESNNLPEK